MDGDGCFVNNTAYGIAAVYDYKDWSESGLSGKRDGLTWKLDKEGHLEITGELLYDGRGAWVNSVIKKCIKTATVSFTRNMNEFYYWYWLQGCKNLESVDFENSDLSELRNFAEVFWGCDSLASVKVPANVGCDIKLPVMDGKVWKCDGEPVGNFISAGINKVCTYENADWEEDVTFASESENVSWSLNSKGEFVMEAKESLPFEEDIKDSHIEAISNQLPWRLYTGYVKKAKFKLHDCENIQKNIQFVNWEMENAVEFDYSECDFPKEELVLWYNSLYDAVKVTFPANANVKYLAWHGKDRFYWLDENNCQVEFRTEDDWLDIVSFKTDNKPTTFTRVTKEEYEAAPKPETPPIEPPKSPVDDPEKPANPPAEQPEPKQAEPGMVAKTEDGSKVTVTKSKDGNASASYTAPKSKKNKKATIPDKVTIDGVEYKVTGIGKGAFKNNKNLITVKIGKNVSQIGKGAFSGCAKLKSVTLPKNVEKIEAEAFKGDKSLKTITIKSTSIKSVGKNAFKGIKGNAVIKVPASKLKEYTKLFRKAGLPETVKIKKI